MKQNNRIHPAGHPYPGTPGQREQLRRRFQQLLEMSLSDCIDTLISFAAGRVVVDIIHIDSILHSRFGDYENRGLSMNDIVKEEYGEAAVQLLNELI